MSREVTLPSSALGITLGITFIFGLFCGYELKTWRIEWLKRRKDRLQRQILKTQSQLDSLQKGI